MCSFNPQLRCGWQCSTRNDQLCQNIVQVNGLAVWAGAVRRRFGGDVKINTINKLSRPSSRSSSTGGAVLFRVKSDRRLNPLLGSGRAFSLLARRRQVGPVEFIFTPVTKVEASSMSSARLQTPPPPAQPPYHIGVYTRVTQDPLIPFVPFKTTLVCSRIRLYVYIGRYFLISFLFRA